MVNGFATDDEKWTILSNHTAGAAAQTAITSDALDMAGFDAVKFFIPIGTIATGGVQSVKLQASSDNDGDDYTDLTGTNIAIADDDDNEVIVIDVLRPEKRYLKAVITRATANSTFGGIYAIQYKRGFNTTASNGSGVTLEQHKWPAEGTA